MKYKVGQRVLIDIRNLVGKVYVGTIVKDCVATGGSYLVHFDIDSRDQNYVVDPRCITLIPEKATEAQIEALKDILR